MNTIFLLAALFFSCNERNKGANMTAPEEDLKISMNEREAFVADMEVKEQNLPPAEIVERKLIRNGTLEFQTEEVKKTKEEIQMICKELDAYISSESENNYGERLQYNQVIRVPSNKFDELILRIEPLAKKIENKNISTEDVTEEFIDVEARLKTKKELEARYREILAQAKTVEDIISIESQIANVRAEIESMEGRLKYLKNQVSFSTLNVTYYETLGTDFGFASKFVDSFKSGWDNLLSFIVLLITLWPFVIAVSLAGIWWWRKRKGKVVTP